MRLILALSCQVIIPALKSEVLAGVRILFSSVIPLGTPPEQSEAWRCAREFGAKCATKLTDEVTHLVSAKVRGFPSNIYFRC